LGQKAVNEPWARRLNWDELSTLAVCLSLDLIEYLIPFMMTPIYGDMIDLIGIAFVFIYFNWYGAISMLELIPGFDVLPLYTITWITWYIQSSSVQKKQLNEQLEGWR
jgi:hypothetical protein